LEEEVLREAIRNASIAEKRKYTEYATFVNEQLRELKIRENISFTTALEIQLTLEQKKEAAAGIVKDAPGPPQDIAQKTIENQPPLSKPEQAESVESFVAGLI
jgi:hypothetical protein